MPNLQGEYRVPEARTDNAASRNAVHESAEKHWKVSTNRTCIFKIKTFRKHAPRVCLIFL